MLKKSKCWPLACLLPFTASPSLLAENLNASSNNDRVFASKTYFLMAVDHEIGLKIKQADIPTLLGVKDIETQDAEVIYFGMRKAMLKYAASAWDSGIASSYGKEVGRIIGWQGDTTYTDTSAERIRNKLLLFRFAQQYRSSNNLIKKYHHHVEREVSKIKANSVDTISLCDPLLPYSDFSFYQSISSASVTTYQILPVVERYESFDSCHKQDIYQQLSNAHSIYTFRDILEIVNLNAKTLP
ncbi:hypothetical protein [Marinomonas ostreistagni]|uniref:Uncharacterized protein n=1 Tax=Marinomonas ostreistagni TaxID=359209 RepID=A0ABS0Z813_9GAMM|nr:hypothetical protein [Marinomonas ostreistagni]MBJ7549759.1 hypothetical protein [Marinomonas ostreistagni]